MKIRTLLIGLALAATVVPAASLASPINKTDRSNALRACTTLRNSIGTSNFTQLFGTFGACVSKMTLTAHQARVQATSACRGKSSFKNCVTSRTQANLNVKLAAVSNAAKTCAQLRASMGIAAFNAAFGTNINDRNAFGKCVSAHARAKPTGQQSVQEFAASISSLNNSGVSGNGRLFLSGNDLVVVLTLNGFESGKTPAAHITGLSSGNAKCPTASADANHDGVISFSEGTASFGSNILDLAVNVAADSSGHVSFVGHYTVNPATLGPLNTRTIVIQGKTVSGTFDASFLAACGEISSH